MITTRRATAEDLLAIVDVNKLDVDEWLHWSIQGMGTKTTYEELAGWERQMHGGSWLHIQALQRYWGFMEKLGITCLVEEINGKVVGHLDVIPTKDRDLGRYLFLDVFMVHKSHRRKGVATTLLKTAEDLAVNLSLPRIIVMIEYDGAGGLTYRKNGYSRYRELFTIESMINHPVMPLRVTVSNPQDSPPLDSHHMTCGWWNTPSKNWM